VIAQALTYFGNDKAFEVIAILSAFVFGGINLFGLFRLSYRIGEATGKRESEMVIIHHDMTGLQTILGIIQTEMKMTTKSDQGFGGEMTLKRTPAPKPAPAETAPTETGTPPAATQPSTAPQTK